MKRQSDNSGVFETFRRASSFKKAPRLTKHYCELSRNSGSTLPRLPPNAKLGLRVKRAFQKLIIVSEHHPYTKVYLRSHAAMAAEKKRHSRSSYWWVIHPYSRFRYFWDNLMTLAFIYFFIVAPYVKALFRICGRQASGFYLVKFVYPVVGLFLVDIVVNFFTGVVAEDGGDILLELSVIARNYSQGFFLLDLITSLPYTLFTSSHLNPPHPDANFLALIGELVPLLKIFRISTLRRYIKQINAAFGLSYVTDIVIWLSLLTLLILHWSACLTWAFPFIVLYATRETVDEADAYVVKNKIHEEDSWFIYLTSLHMGTSNLVGSHFIELTATSISDKVIRCILLVLGTGYMIYVIVVFLQLIESSAEPELKYQEIISRVGEFIEDKRLPKTLADRLIQYYEYRYQGSYFKENAITSTLSNHLKLEINIRSNRGLLETATILYNLPRSLLANLINSMTPVIYLENDVIYKTGDDADCMYFIASGTVAFINSMGRELQHLVDGDHFGEFSLLHLNQPRESSIIATETSELLQLHRRSFTRLILPDTELHQRLTLTSEKRQQILQESLEQAQNEENMKNRWKLDVRRLLMKVKSNNKLNN